MGQCDLASATALAAGEGDREGDVAPIGSCRFHAKGTAQEIAALAALLPEFKIERRPRVADAGRSLGIACWAGSRLRSLIQRRTASPDIPFLSLGPGVLRAPPRWRGAGAPPVLSVTAHTLSGPSSRADFLDPGRLLVARGWESSALLARAAVARRDIVSRRLGGAWWNSAADPELPRGDELALVIIGEGTRRGVRGSSSPALLATMLAAALAENPPHRIVLIAPDDDTHPFFRGVQSDAVACGCTVLTRPIDPWQAIERAARLYTAGGETGFLALLAGTQIRCFADSFYSGWGITTDDPRVSQRSFRRTVDEVFAGACLVATRYLEPFRNTMTSFEDILEIVGGWRHIEAANRRIAVCLGMSLWKRRQVADFLRSSAGPPAFRRTTKAALKRVHGRPEGAIAVWASRAPPGLAAAAKRHGVPVIRVEDGFVRSVGLGSDFLPAASLVFDSRGMHFDPSVRSDLELLLLRTEFTPALIERARALTAQLVARGVTKYNLGTRASALEPPAGKRRILVPGQVEDDLSVRLGGEGVSGNLDLLARVRAANPEAFILYKPHPDVEAGHRKGRISDEAARNFADRVIRDVSTAAVLDEIDELHTLTSLAGFEALLRQRRVVVYGRPFYAGWGLTIDLAGIDRGRCLALEELVAGALILYPRYLDPVTRLPCGPEIVIERLDNPELWRPGPLVAARRLQGILARRWNKLAEKAGRLSARQLPPAGRDDFRTPQL